MLQFARRASNSVTTADGVRYTAYTEGRGNFSDDVINLWLHHHCSPNFSDDVINLWLHHHCSPGI